MAKTSDNKGKNKKRGAALIFVGGFLFLGGALILCLTGLPFLKAELEYRANQKNPLVIDNVLTDSLEFESNKGKIDFAQWNFGIFIPKLEVKEKVVENVDPFVKNEYQQKLESGIAHAKGTALPDGNGNVFLFAHSSNNFYDHDRFNTDFYLLNKLEPEDEVYLSYQKKLYIYKVFEKKVVDSAEVEYLEDQKGNEALTLMTCWPIGSSSKRLLVFAEKEK